MKSEHGQLQNIASAEQMNMLRRKNFAHLGCAAGREVYVVPITYALEGDYIYSHSRQGHKIEVMRKHPDVCIQVEEITDLFHWKSVIAWGRYEELEGDQAAQASRILLQSVVKNFAEKVSQLELDFAAITVKSIFFRLRIERMTGRQEN